MKKPLVYEVTLDIGAELAPEFDTWLADHVRAMLALPGFTDARILSPEDLDSTRGSPTTARRVVQYTLAGRVELDRYLTEHAPRMRAEGVTRFGEKLKTSRRVLDVDQSLAGTSTLPGLVLMPETERCRNCGTPLNGRFCAECGQRNHSAVSSLREITEDFAGTHFGFDTKFIHSIVPLLFRPGFLTREYCIGRQERYIKPFRLYLFSSVVFFFLAAFLWSPSASTGKTSNLSPKARAEMSVADREATRTELKKALAEIKAKPGEDEAEKRFAEAIVMDQLAKLDQVANAPSGATRAQVAAVTTDSAPAAASKHRSTASYNYNGGDIDIDLPSDYKPKDAAESSFIDKLSKIKDNQDQFKHQLYQNLPKMMLLFMPLIALFLKLLYIGSKRLFTEHFVFTLHYHAFVFVVMLAVMLIGFGARHIIWLEPLKREAGTVAGWYVTIYLFLALRFFYRQSWFMTSVKFCMLFISYCMAAGVTLAAAVALTAAEL
ncbi:MAG TPA: DUF4286 family protein [Gammaproteobacteria bacterium]|nr:DUF4286 family protein [Gammaproteobacteria bacterium]